MFEYGFERQFHDLNDFDVGIFFQIPLINIILEVIITINL